MTKCPYEKSGGGKTRRKTRAKTRAKTLKRGGKRVVKPGRSNVKPKVSRKKKSRGKKRPLSKWQIHLMKVFREMKTNDKSIKLGDAMREAKKSYK